ncbi:hypothetical protein CDEF62S_05941 [Castellaniella defragrans]
MKLLNLLSSLTVAGFCLSAPFAVQAQQKPEIIGLPIFTFTSGPAAAYGMPGKNGATLLIDQINAAGGIAGVKIKPTFVDEAQGTPGVIAEYRRLAAQPDNEVIIAALSSANCLALAPIAQQLQVPTVAWNCDTHQLLEGKNNHYMYRPNGNTVPEFAAYAIYLLDRNPNIKTVGLIDPDYALGHDAATIFKATLHALKPDVKVVAELYPKLGSGNYQTEITKLSSARPDVIFSSLWGADLENFVRQAAPRGLFTSSQAVLALGETILQRLKLPDGVIVGVLGDGYWLSPDAQANPETKKFAEEYKKRFGEYPVFPSMKMANSIMYIKAAYENAMKKNGDKWPSRAELAQAMHDSTVKTLTGTTVTRPDNDGVVDQIVGVTAKSPKYDFSVMSDMVRYHGDSLMPKEGQDPIAWISTLTPAAVAQLPKPGSYK